jgi:hypothetical protein
MTRSTCDFQIGQDALEAQGRFKKELETKVIGAGATPTYPQLPADSPWACEPVPDELPVGVDVSAPIDIGEPAPPQPLCSSSQEDGGAGGRAPAIAQQSERARPANLKRRRMP